MDNPRTAFANDIRQELAAKDTPMSVQAFAEKLAKILVKRKLREPGSETAAIAYVYAVLNEHRTVPKGCEAAWGEAIGWHEGSDAYQAFLERIQAARAWGKSDGRDHVARTDLRVAKLTAEVAEYKKALAKSEAQRQALEDRIAFLEAEESGGFQTGKPGV